MSLSIRNLSRILQDRCHVSRDNRYKQLGGGNGCHEGYAEKLTKESEEKDAWIKLQDEKIAKLTKKLEKWPARFVTKDSESEEEVKSSLHSEASNEELHSKKGDKYKNNCSSRLRTWLQIQSRNNLEEVLLGPTYTLSLTPKELTHSAYLTVINLSNPNNLIEKATQSSMLHISSRHAKTLALMTT